MGAFFPLQKSAIKYTLLIKFTRNPLSQKAYAIWLQEVLKFIYFCSKDSTHIQWMWMYAYFCKGIFFTKIPRSQGWRNMGLWELYFPYWSLISTDSRIIGRSILLFLTLRFCSSTYAKIDRKKLGAKLCIKDKWMLTEMELEKSSLIKSN